MWNKLFAAVVGVPLFGLFGVLYEKDIDHE
jgi:hypothetical protein